MFSFKTEIISNQQLYISWDQEKNKQFIARRKKTIIMIRVEMNKIEQKINREN